jgi:type I restriction enzyme, R subunit
LGIADQLRSVMRDYTADSQGQTGIPQEQAIALMLSKYENLTVLLGDFDYSLFFTGTPSQRVSIILAAMDHVLGLEDGQQQFIKAVNELAKAFALYSYSDEATAIRDEVSLFQAIRAAFVKHTTTGGKSPEDVDTAIRQIVSNAVVSNEVVDIFAAAGVENPDISILSDEFLADARQLPQRHLALELLRKLISDEI